MMNIYAHTFMIATLSDGEVQGLRERPRQSGWIVRARRWIKARV